MRISMLILILGLLSGCAQQQDTPTALILTERDAFIASVLSINKARMLSQPPPSYSNDNYALSPFLERSIDSLTSYGVATSRQVSDSYLKSIHPELVNVYRTKLIAGARLWQQGIRKSRAHGGVAGVEEQALGTRLDNEWMTWLNQHADVSKLVIR